MSIMKLYPLDEKDLSQVAGAFKYHPENEEQNLRYEYLRGEFHHLAETVLKLCPPSRERALAMTNLEQAAMWANASIARNEK